MVKLPVSVHNCVVMVCAVASSPQKKDETEQRLGNFWLPSLKKYSNVAVHGIVEKDDECETNFKENW